MMLDIGLDLFPLIAAVLAALTCGVLGNFLVLRRLSLMGDAISHAVLPGLVIAFLLTSARDPLAMFAGAAIAGVATVVLVELVKKLGRVEPGAAMGVVFSLLFALGVLLIEKAAARHVDLDADCVLHGQLEMLAWYGAPESVQELFTVETMAAVPRQVWVLLIACGASIAFVVLLFKELRIAAFDPELATTQGYNSTVLHYMLMVFVALATVAAFEAVGSILVIALLVCPAATARLLTDRLGSQIMVCGLLSAGSAVLGYVAATAVPTLFEKESVNAAGSIAVMTGVLLLVAAFVSPRSGVVVRVVRRRALATSIVRDDLLTALYRVREQGQEIAGVEGLKSIGAWRRTKRALRWANRSGLVDVSEAGVVLTDAGVRAGAELIRKHRLWESYLVERAGMAADHVHDIAENLEHLEGGPRTGPVLDPHGRPIPEPSSDNGR